MSHNNILPWRLIADYVEQYLWFCAHTYTITCTSLYAFQNYCMDLYRLTLHHIISNQITSILQTHLVSSYTSYSVHWSMNDYDAHVVSLGHLSCCLPPHLHVLFANFIFRNKPQHCVPAPHVLTSVRNEHTITYRHVVSQVGTHTTLYRVPFHPMRASMQYHPY